MQINQKKFLCLSLDGASWSGFDFLMKERTLPVITSLVNSGSYGSLHCMLPTFTYPNWASFWTGENPSRQGIFAFNDIGISRGLLRKVDWTSLKSPTWLEQISNNGFKIISIHAPLTLPPPQINGFVIADQHTITTEDFIYPPDFAGILKTRFKELHLPKAEQFFPHGGFKDSSDIDKFIEDQIWSIKQTKELAEYMLTECSWNVAIIHLFATDPLQHALWHLIDPRHPGFEIEGHNKVVKFFKELDSIIGHLIKIANPTAKLVFSSHGFVSTKRIFNISRALAEAGISRRRLFTRKIVKPENILLDHKALYIQNKKFGNGDTANKIIRAFERVRDPESGSLVIKKAWHARELYDGFRQDGWDVVILEFNEGYTSRNGDAESPILSDLLKPGKDYLIGTHTQTGVWILSGEGIITQPGFDASITDLPPTILTYLGQKVPTRMDGKVLPVFL